MENCNQEINQQIIQHYEAKPYESYSFPNSKPSHMATVASLVGIQDIPCFSSGKILEIGCASGGNIIPLAYRYPQAKFIALDIVPSQIELAKQKAQKLGLNNIEFFCVDFSALPDDFSTFDYIIAHGVYSWISKEMQLALLQVIKKHLNPNGLAFVSYNAYPGWHYREILRDAMLFSSRNSSDSIDKQNMGELMIKFLKQVVKDDAPHTELMKKTLELIPDEQLGIESYYIAHEYLDICNNPVYFKDFILMAMEYDLGFVGEAEVHGMFHPVPPQTFDDLDLIAQYNRLAIEQTLDFVKNRSFRQTIITHKDSTTLLNGSLSQEAIKKLYFCSDFKYIATENNIKYYEYSDVQGNIGSMTAKVPLAEHVFELIGAAYPSYISYTDIAQQICQRMKLETLNKEQEANLLILFTMMIHGHSADYSIKPLQAVKLSNQPKVDEYIRQDVIQYQSTYVSTIGHHKMKFGPVDRAIISLLDGKLTIEQIIDTLLPRVEEFNLSLLEGETSAEEALKDRVPKCLNRYAVNGILAA